MTDGALPFGTAPLTPVDGDFAYTVTAVGILDDAQFYDLRIAGTNTTGAHVAPGVAWTASPASGVGAKWVLSVSLERRSGASAPGARLRLLELSPTSFPLASSAQLVSPGLVEDLFVLEAVTANPGVAAVRGQFEFARVAPGGSIDVTYRLRRQQLQPDQLTAWVPTGAERSVDQTNTLTATPGLLRRSSVSVPPSVQRAIARKIIKAQAPLGSVTLFMALLAMRSAAASVASFAREVRRYVPVQAAASVAALLGAREAFKRLAGASEAVPGLERATASTQPAAAGGVGALSRSAGRRSQAATAPVGFWRATIARALAPGAVLADAWIRRSAARSLFGAADSSASVRRRTAKRARRVVTVTGSARRGSARYVAAGALGVAVERRAIGRTVAPAFALAIAALRRSSSRALEAVADASPAARLAIAWSRRAAAAALAALDRAMARTRMVSAMVVGQALRRSIMVVAAGVLPRARLGRGSERRAAAAAMAVALRSAALKKILAAAGPAVASRRRALNRPLPAVVLNVASIRRAAARLLRTGAIPIPTFSRGAIVLRVAIVATAGAAASAIARWAGIIRRRAALMIRTWRS